MSRSSVVDRGADVVEAADAIVTTGAGRTGRALLDVVLRAAAGEAVAGGGGAGTAVPSPAELFDAFATARHVRLRQGLAEIFDVVAAPGETIALTDLRAGDVVVRRAPGEAGLTHLAVLASGAMSRTDLAEAGLTPEPRGDGVYASVIEAGHAPRGRAAAFARRIAGAGGRLDADQLVLRVRPRAAWSEDEPFPSSRLRWAQATEEQVAFMRDVYDRQVRRAAARRAFVPDVPDAGLATIEGGHRARTAAAADCRALLAECRGELRRLKDAGDPRAQAVERVAVTSAYRSATQQLASWQGNFPRYYDETATARGRLAGGEHGTAAADHLARYIAQRLGAPGFSLHNDGRAIDFVTVEDGATMGASTRAANIRSWRGSWCFAWLTANAARFNFHQNTAIDEPWHWEHRAQPPADTEGVEWGAPESTVIDLDARELETPDASELETEEPDAPETIEVESSDGESGEAVVDDDAIEAETAETAIDDTDGTLLLEPAPVADERFSDPTENWLPAPVHVVLDRNARIRSGPPDFAATGGRIPYWTRVWLNETRGQYMRVTGADGTAYGWTAASNIGTFFKDLPHLLSTPLAPATPVALGAAPSALRRALADTYNRLGGLMAYVASETGIEVAAVLAVWHVESGGRRHTPGRAIIRFENHLLFDRWGSAHPGEYDRHFQHGSRAGVGGDRWENHRWRDDPSRPFARFHGDQDAEYRVLAFATALADEATALQCISIGGPQILISGHRMLGYDTPRAMSDAFQAGERAQVLGFFDFCQYKYGHGARRGELLRDLAALRWADFTRGYNGAGQVAEYSAKLRTAHAEAVTIMPARPTPNGTRPTRESAWEGDGESFAETTKRKLPTVDSVVQSGKAVVDFVPIETSFTDKAGRVIEGRFWVTADAIKWEVPTTPEWSWWEESEDPLTGKRRMCRLPCCALEAQAAADRVYRRQAELAGRRTATNSKDAAPSLLLTPRLYDLRWAQADLRIDPCSGHIDKPLAVGSNKMNKCVNDAARRIFALPSVFGHTPPLLADPGKIWAITNDVYAKKAKDGNSAAVNYGWHVTKSWRDKKSAAVTPGQFVVQGPGTAHGAQHIDYSQVCVLVAGWCEIVEPGLPPEWKLTMDVYTHPALCKLVTHDGRPLRVRSYLKYGAPYDTSRSSAAC